MQDNTFGEALKARRNELGLSQTELAVRASTTQAIISRIENGQAPELPTLRKIGDALAGRIVIHPRGEVEFAPEYGLLPGDKKLHSAILWEDEYEPLRNEMRWAIRKVMNDEGVSTALRVFADEAKQRARELFMLATNSTLSLDRTCPAYLIGRRCLAGSDDGCPLCDVPGRDHIEMYDCDGEPKFYVMHVYEMSGSTAHQLDEFCERWGLVFQI